MAGFFFLTGFKLHTTAAGPFFFLFFLLNDLVVIQKSNKGALAVKCSLNQEQSTAYHTEWSKFYTTPSLDLTYSSAFTTEKA